jgi:hypothetical protein
MPFPKSTITTTYLMTVHVPLEAPKTISTELTIHNCQPGGWVRGPHIGGTVISPTADWLRVMPNGTQRLDVRLTILADDGSYIFMSYLGRIVSAEQRALQPRPDHAANGERYFITNPVFETDSRRYGWLNDVVTVGKIVPSPDLEVTYDIFAVD